MSISIVEKLGKQVPFEAYNKNDISFQQEPTNVFGEETNDFYQFRNPSKSLKENNKFSENNLKETDKGYDLSGSFMQTNPSNGGFNGLSGRGKMSNLYLYPEYQLKSNSDNDKKNYLTYREKHSYDYERLMKYDAKQLKDPRLKPCKGHFKGDPFKVPEKEVSLQNLKSHISGYKKIDKGAHGPFFKQSFNDFIPDVKKDTDEKPMETPYDHYVEVGDTSRYGRHGRQDGNDYIDRINRRGRDDKVSTTVLNKMFSTHSLYGDGRYAGFSGFGKK